MAKTEHATAQPDSGRKPPENASMPPNTPPLPLHPVERGFIALENGIVLTIMAIFFGFLGLVVDGRCFVALCVPLLLGIHRSRAFAGLSIRAQAGLHFGILIVSAACFWWCGVQMNKPKTPPPSVPTQVDTRPESELPTLGFVDESDEVEATFGTNSGAEHIKTLKALNGQPTFPLYYNGATPVSFRYAEGKVSYSVKFWSPSQQSVIEVTDGKFVVRNDGLDKNYSQRALEVVTKDGDPILQIIWVSAGHMKINGLFPIPDGSLLCVSESTMNQLPSGAPVQSCRIPPIFKYPSWKYPGDMVSSPPVSVGSIEPPKLSLREPGFLQIPNDNKHVRLSIPIDNDGGSSAFDLEMKLLFFDQDNPDKKRLSLFTSAQGEIAAHTAAPFYKDDITLGSNVPPQYVVVWLRYKDQARRILKPQTFYMQWSGVTDGKTQPNFPHVTIEQSKYLDSVVPAMLGKIRQQ